MTRLDSFVSSSFYRFRLMYRDALIMGRWRLRWMRWMPALLIVLVASHGAFAATLDVRIVGLVSNSDFVETGGQVDFSVQARLDADGAPTTAGLAEWTLRIQFSSIGNVTIPNVCNTSAFQAVAVDADGNWQPFLAIVDCDSSAHTVAIAGGSYREGELVPGVGNGPEWVTIAVGVVDTPWFGPCVNLLAMTPVELVATTIDAGQVEPPYQTTPVENSGIAFAGLNFIYTNPPCLSADVNCDGYVNAGDIGVVASGANWGSSDPFCFRSDVNADGAVNAYDIGVVASSANFGSVLSPCFCSLDAADCGAHCVYWDLRAPGFASSSTGKSVRAVEGASE